MNRVDQQVGNNSVGWDWRFRSDRSPAELHLVTNPSRTMNRYGAVRWLLFLVATWAAIPALAGTDPFTIRDIRIEGLQRIAPGTVFNYLPLKVGDRLDNVGSSAAIRALFKTGFFQDVRLEREEDLLVVAVVERPAIASVEFSGNREIETDKLKGALKDTGLAEGRVFDRSMLSRIEQELQRQYFGRGKYGVKIQTTVTPLVRNRVGIIITINEGHAARIHRIALVGNQAFTDKVLRKQMELDTGGWWSWLTKDDQYSKAKLAADLETLRSWYMDRGYLNFTIDSTQVSLTPDKKDVYITLNLTEGEVYTFKDIKLSGNLVVPEEKLRELLKLEPGEVFSRRKVTDAATAISDRLGEEGYAFANVNPVPELDKNTRKVSLTFFVDPGKRVYVRRINFSGNTKTSDIVLRREMRQMEAATVDTSKLKRSRTRLDRLGFFDEVNMQTPAVTGTPDVMDVNFNVTERPSGSVMAGIGYGQTQGVILSASVNQDNFLGTGNHVVAAFNNSQITRVYSISYTNPYWTKDGISRTIGVYDRSTDAAQANLAAYTADTYGTNISFGVPINEFDGIRLGVGYDNYKISETDNTPNIYRQYLSDNGNTFGDFKLTAAWAHDTRNRAIFPDRGVWQYASFETTVPGSSLDYYKLEYRHHWYRPLTDTFTLLLRGEIGYGSGWGKNQGSLPFFDRFYAGGATSVRGFRDNTLGPKVNDPGKLSDGRPLGGDLRLVGGVEVLFPAPFAKDNKQLRLSGFMDFGNVYGIDEKFDAGQLRYTVGMAANWQSPLGPLVFSLAKPINSLSRDERQMFQFTIGTSF
ncbi:Outer membrane protein assembly factor BamA [Gammaproteobacteria bacterium]